MRKNFRVLRELVRIRFQKLMMFRLGFFGPFFVDGSLFAIQLIVFKAIYSNVDRIGSWGSGEMILYIGTFSLLNAVSMVVCFFGITDLPNKIKKGDLDLYLTKPVSPLLRITFECINPGSIPLVLMSLCIIAYGVRTCRIPLCIGSVAAYCFWILIMLILYYEMEVLLRCASFFLVSNARLEQLEEVGLELCMKLPGIAFYGIYKIIFYCILPYGIMATLPVQSLIGELNLQTAVFGITISAVFTAFTALVWRCGVRHYNSASS